MLDSLTNYCLSEEFFHWHSTKNLLLISKFRYSQPTISIVGKRRNNKITNRFNGFLQSLLMKILSISECFDLSNLRPILKSSFASLLSTQVLVEE